MLRLGAYQLRWLTRVPSHAAVSTSVELARETVGEGATVLLAKGLVTPQRTARLQYSAPTVDEAGGVETHSEGEGGTPPRASAGAAGNGSNRSARRAKRGKRG